MELFFLCGVIIFALIVAYSLSLLFSTKRPNASASNLPPGKFGLPYVGESLQFLSTSRNGHPEKFIYDRMTKYTTKIFKTSILGEPTVVLCGSAGNKFLFTSENKYVQAWWPRSVDKIFPNPTNSAVTDESRKMRKLLPDFLKPQALQRYIGIMDNIAQRHFASNWEGKQEITVYPLAQRYTFWLACKLFVSIDDPQHIKKYADAFDLVTSGIISIPIDFPGTAFNRGIKASSYIRKELLSIIKQRKTDLAENRASPNQDILSHMLLTSNEDGEYMSEFDIASKILGLIVGGEGTATSVITFIVKYLADHPGIYDRVLKEQLEIANSKKPGEFINWVDVQKMKYSWNVACEVMRLVPPVLGTFREAIEDFIFEGYTIPKGWKIYYSTRFNHKNPEYFPEPEKFDPSRFEGSGPAPYTFIPFGGGPRICPGKEYARMEILVFLHNIIKRFKWKLLIPDEKIIMDPIPRPAKGLPIGLVAH